MSTTRRSTLQQSLDVDLYSLKANLEVQAFSCDVSGRWAVLGDSAGLLLVVSGGGMGGGWLGRPHTTHGFTPLTLAHRLETTWHCKHQATN